MEREIDMREVSDGRLYTANDLVKADCRDCHGCSSCCRGMGSSIILDPYDLFSLSTGLHQEFGELLENRIELNIADHLILPNLKMRGEEEACVFLNAEGRCSVHAFRPGMCRLFPLGRFYEGDGFKYFLQVHECPKADRAKIKVHKWLGIPDLKSYEQFVRDWHHDLKALRERVKGDPERIKELSMELLKRFYMEPYDLARNFYEQFYERRQPG